MEGPNSGVQNLDTNHVLAGCPVASEYHFDTGGPARSHRPFGYHYPKRHADRCERRKRAYRLGYRAERGPKYGRIMRRHCAIVTARRYAVQPGELLPI
jgi:hypothetical protein